MDYVGEAEMLVRELGDDHRRRSAGSRVVESALRHAHAAGLRTRIAELEQENHQLRMKLAEKSVE